MRSAIEVLGSIAIIGIAAISLAFGASLFLFSLDLERLDEASRNPSVPPGELLKKGAQDLEKWRDVFALAGESARVAALNDKIPMSVGRRLQTDVAALSAFPTDGLLWIAYARSVAQSGVPFQNAANAIEVSRLCSPNEQIPMVGRLLFTLEYWAKFSPQERLTALRDITRLRTTLWPIERTAIADRASQIPSDQRANIESLLNEVHSR